jgi:PAS domain S-box-containing protein
MFWNRVDLLPVRDGSGTVTHYLGFQEDVTEQVRREQELERYHALVQAADDPIYTLDADGYVTDVNDAFCSLTGYDHADIVGAHASKAIDDRDVEAMEELIRSELTDGDQTDDDSTTTGQTAEVVVETVDGDRRLCEVSVGFLPSEEGFRGTVGILRDVTEPRGREQRLAVLERVLRHNLRNKTNVALSRVERLQADDRLPEDLEAELDIVTDAVTDIIDLSEQARQFRDVLALQRQELATVDVVPIVTDAVEELRSAHEHATIETALPDSACARVRGRLRFAIDELLDNAISHTESDSTVVSVAVTEHDDTVEISVADNGPGLPEPERKVATRERERPLEHGSGLGLWLVRWTVEQSCGRMVFGEGETDSLEAVDQSTKSDGSADGATVRMILPRAD